MTKDNPGVLAGLQLPWLIFRVLCGAASVTTGVVGLWGISADTLSPLGFIVVIPAIVCGLYAVGDHQ